MGAPRYEEKKKKKCTYLQYVCCGKANAVEEEEERRRRRRWKRPGPSWDLAKFHRVAHLTKSLLTFCYFITKIS
jgi:hypothetical protein